MSNRQVPPIEAMLAGFSPEEIQLLQKALDYFDGSYEEMLDHLKDLGASKSLYARVNGAIRLVMDKGRGEVNLLDYTEMMTWGDGYTGATDTIDNLDQAAQRAAEAFRAAIKRWQK